MSRYLAAFTVDAFGTTALALLALPTGSPELLLLAAVAAIGVLLAAIAFGAHEEAGRRGVAVGLLVAGLAITTAGCAAVLIGPVGHAHPLTLPAALVLLVVGDLLSVVYLRQIVRAAP
ncbi:hypothetical protein ITJ64_15305 [Herbiconiux sp. VKM Ac-1786]|uniref:hypothetical protein n=1 Tax=Herbiconiux sp. VKM Ac-1786 TaxID=2783824 RepID=UPI00188C0B5C|nr:hypothetical protein [Herbiconiux sp. VKM Ac-1786]MBF4573884.1 hypothetical protein [Herbiconiux sp. VKM Ac-1786]